MCAVSATGDFYIKQKAWPNWPSIVPFPTTQGPTITKPVTMGPILDVISREEFEALKRDFEKVKVELEAAKAQDIANGEPDCEMDEKVDIIQQIADMLKISLGDIFKK